MTVPLKTLIELGEPFAYAVIAVRDDGLCRLKSRDGEHVVLVSASRTYLRRWERELNRAYERGVKIGIAVQLAVKECV